MRIVHVLTRLLRAGSEENTIASCLSQAAAGHEVYLIHGKDYDGCYQESIGSQVNLIKANSLVHTLSPSNDIIASIQLSRLFRAIGPDIVHTHQSKAGIIGRLSARIAGVPCIIHGVHIAPFVNVSLLERSIYLAAERAAASMTHAFIDVSRGVRDIYVSHKVGSPDKHHVVHSGFKLKRFRQAEYPADWRDILAIGPNDPKPPTIVMVAALEPRKRHKEFIEVFPRILTAVPQARLLLAGEGPAHNETAATIQRLGLAKNVNLLGFRKDPEKIIALADICALTSAREGLPRVVMQYLSAGRPAVVNDLPGLDEVLKHGRNGLIAPPDDLAGVADGIRDLLLDPERLKLLADGARNTDLSSWEVDNMCAQIEHIYDLVSEGRTCTTSTSMVAS
jgi:glycosyltransferase involved in cell wall biosynthesis